LQLFWSFPGLYRVRGPLWVKVAPTKFQNFSIKNDCRGPFVSKISVGLWDFGKLTTESLYLWAHNTTDIMPKNVSGPAIFMSAIKQELSESKMAEIQDGGSKWGSFCLLVSLVTAYTV